MIEAKKSEIRPLKVLAWFFVLWAFAASALVVIVLGTLNHLYDRGVSTGAILLTIALLCLAAMVSMVGGGIIMAIYKQGEFTLDLTETIRRRQPRAERA